MFPIRPLRLAVLSTTLVLVLSSCSKFAVDQADINRDAASRCVQNIDAWKRDLAKLELLEGEFDLISGQIRHGYSKAAPEEKTTLRRRVGNVLRAMDQTAAETDARFREIMRELEYVSRDKRARARIAAVTSPLRDAEGIRSPEIRHAMDIVSSQLQTLLRVD
jgi:hypothetical protein